MDAEETAGEDVEADEEEHVAEEGVAPKVLRDPGQPTQQQRREHECTHVPYRSWCHHCVRGRAKGRPRRRLHGQDVPDI